LIALADTFNNKSVIDRTVFAVLGDSLVGLAVIPILCSFHVRELRNDDSLNRITFKDFTITSIPIGTVMSSLSRARRQLYSALTNSSQGACP
jgi:hypothetical protein